MPKGIKTKLAADAAAPAAADAAPAATPSSTESSPSSSSSSMSVDAKRAKTEPEQSLDKRDEKKDEEKDEKNNVKKEAASLDKRDEKKTNEQKKGPSLGKRDVTDEPQGSGGASSWRTPPTPPPPKPRPLVKRAETLDPVPEPEPEGTWILKQNKNTRALEFTSAKYTRARTGATGKAAWCAKNNIGHLFDDNADICREALSKGLTAWPIRAGRERHGWVNRAWDSLHSAVSTFLHEEALNS